MEYPNQTITNIIINDNIVHIEYDNNMTENLSIGKDTYVRMHDTWLKEQPPFISDLFKIQMRNIILATINNNERCIHDLNIFFSSSNVEEVKRFLTYMRKRDLTSEKEKWTPIS